VLTLEGVRGEGVPAVLFEVYVNLPAGQKPDPTQPYYVGNLNLFGVQPWDSAPGHQHRATQRFNISRNVAALQARGEWTGELQLTFIPYNLTATPESSAATAEAAAAPWATIESVSVATG
jgi:hypothetical protein